jgi:membrane-bound ClpP family serine protease
MKPVTCTMSNKLSKNFKSYKTAATLYSISGIIFIIISAVSGKVGVFLPVGIASIILGIVFWQYGKKLVNS